MLKMFRGRDRRSQGGVSHNDVQIFKHLEEADVDTLVDELAVLTDDAADGNVDLDKINAYLDALLSRNEAKTWDCTSHNGISRYSSFR